MTIISEIFILEFFLMPDLGPLLFEFYLFTHCKLLGIDLGFHFFIFQLNTGELQVNTVDLQVLFILKYKSFLQVIFISRFLVLHLLDQEVVLLILGLMNNLCTRFGNLSTRSLLQYSAR